MRNVTIAMLLLILLAPRLFARAGDQQTSPTKRLSVVDVGQKKKVPPAFIDLLYIAFLKQPDVVLLEREQVWGSSEFRA